MPFGFEETLSPASSSSRRVRGVSLEAFWAATSAWTWGASQPWGQLWSQFEPWAQAYSILNFFKTDSIKMFQTTFGQSMNLLDKSDLKNFLQKIASSWPCVLYFYLT